MNMEIRLIGSGGHGIVTTGRLIALSAIETNRDLYVVYSPSYGFAARGGSVRSDIIVSEQPIDYPKTSAIDLLVGLSQIALPKSFEQLKDDGAIIIDSRLVNNFRVKEYKRIHSFRIVETAREVGGEIFASTVSLGVISSIFPELLNREATIKVIETSFRDKLVKTNLEAFERGLALSKNALRTG